MTKAATLLVAWLGIAQLCGCAAPASDQRAAPAADAAPFNPAADAAPIVDLANQSAGQAAPTLQAGGRERLRVVQMDIYQLTVPLGAISRSDEFWKHIDEQRLDVATYDLLLKNGWRVGVAPNSDWSYFKDIIDVYPASAKPTALSAGPVGGGAMELPLKKGIAYQNIFFFTDDGTLQGRTYERCDNFISIAFQQAPRRLGDVRVTVCPTVRSLRKRFEVNKKNEEREIRYVNPERLYDLNLQADIPIDHFLVIAPSPEVRWKTSLGNTFLVRDSAAEQVETALLLIPRVRTGEERVPADVQRGATTAE